MPWIIPVRSAGANWPAAAISLALGPFGATFAVLDAGAGAATTTGGLFSSIRASAFLTSGSHSAPSPALDTSARHRFSASSRRPSCLALSPS